MMRWSDPRWGVHVAILTLTTYVLPGLAPVEAQPVEVPNADFTAGESDPEGWRLSGGNGRWLDRSVLAVSGSGEDSSYWRCDGIRFEPRELYSWKVRARRRGGNGTVILGPGFANRDFPHVGSEWEWHEFVFRAPETTRGAYARLGQWHSTGTVEFDEVRSSRVLPVHNRIGKLVLGEGESIDNGQYTFLATFGGRGSNYHRPLETATASFNSDRWVFGAGSEVVYRFALPAPGMRAGRLRFNVNHHTAGACIAEVRADDGEWREVGRKDGVGNVDVELPAAAFPARELRVRLRADSSPCTFQVNRIELDGELVGSPPEGAGDTVFAELDGALPGLAIDRVEMEPQGDTSRLLGLTLRNETTRALRVVLVATDVTSGASAREVATVTAELERGKSRASSLALDLSQPGRHDVAVELRTAGDRRARLRFAADVPEYYRADFGSRIDAEESGVALWWCESGWKVSPRRAAPKKASAAVEMEAARGDFEAVQLIVRPEEQLAGLRASASDLRGPGGAVIAKDHVRILRVAYHDVRHLTDATGVRGRWPDALPPLRAPITVPAGENQPLWVLVGVPREAAPGQYEGRIELRADGWSASAPLRLHVWKFALPEKNHIETAFGFSPGNVYRYHGLKSEAERRAVIDLYFRSFSEHRISPYNPNPLDPIAVKFLPDADPPRAEVDFARFDTAMKRAVEEFHFTGIRLPVQGMGGGTFHRRYAPTIAGFGEETSQYRAMFSSYVGQLEEHLRARGWLDLAYVYWFDEPDPKDYAFVVNGMKRLGEHAPGLRRMLTEEPKGDLAGAVDIWCPVSHNFNDEDAKSRLDAGEKLWWYVCTGPKAPYCTLFIDHPATELRVWLWQSWKRSVTGILVWQSNYWTSSAAFPDEAQNPYADPMGYVSGYSTPRGVKRHWGNGDGRFIYPPESAAVPGSSGTDPVIEPPASSIRWEMLREGVEDWEFLYLLRSLIAKRRAGLSPAALRRYEALLEVPAEISSNMTTFTKDPRPIHARRRQIALAIEALLD